MKAMILAAGKGTRLRPVTHTTPKPMLDVHGRPLIEHQIGWLREAGITDIVINLHHLGEQIEGHIGDGSAFGVRVRYSRETELLETGGGIRNALPLLGDDTFALLNGDIFTDFCFSDLPADVPAGDAMHMVVTPKPAFREHGDFEYQAGRITARGESHVYCGIALLNHATFAGYGDAPFSLRDIFFATLAEGRLSAQLFEGAWTDIGTIEQWRELNSAKSPE